MKNEIRFYTPERLAQLEAVRRRQIVGIAGIVLAGAALCAVGLVLRRQMLCIAAVVAAGWAVFYRADVPARGVLDVHAFAQRMCMGQKRQVEGVWEGVSAETVYVEGVRAAEVCCRTENGIRRFYVHFAETVPQIPDGTPVRIEAVERFITGICLQNG